MLTRSPLSRRFDTFDLRGTEKERRKLAATAEDKRRRFAVKPDSPAMAAFVRAVEESCARLNARCTETPDERLARWSKEARESWL